MKKTKLNRTSSSTAAVGIIFHLADGTIQSCNTDAEKILGYAAEQLIGTSLWELPWQTMGETEPAIAILSTNQPYSDVVMGFSQPGGNLVCLSIDTLPLFRENKAEPYGVEVRLRDITEDIETQNTSQALPLFQIRTDRQSALTDILRHQKFTKQIVDAIPGVVYIYDAIARQNIYVNSPTENLLGYTPQQISEMGTDFVTQIMHPEDLARFPAHLKRLEQSLQGEICDFEYRMRHRNGEWRWFCSQDRVYSRTADGSVRQILGVAQDISKRKEQETQLAITNNILQSIIRDSDDAIFVKDIEGRYVIANQTAADWLNLTVEEMLDRDDTTLFTPEIARSIMAMDRQVMTEGKMFSFEEEVAFGEEQRSLISSKYPWRDEKGKTLGIIGISKDITVLKESAQKLKENEQLLRLALSSANAGTWNWEIETGKIVWSPENYDLYGVDLQIGHPQYQDWKNRLHPEEREQVHERVQQVVLGQLPEFNGEFRIIHPQRGVRWIWGLGNVTLDDKNKPFRLSGINIDVTERKLTEEKLRQSEQHLRRVLDSLYSFVGVLTPDGILIEANRTAIESGNLQPEDVLNKPFSETYWWSYDPKIQAQLKDAIQQAAAGEIVRYDVIVRLSEDRFIPIDFSIVPLFDDNGRVEYLIPSGIDLSEREASKQALVQREYELRLITEVIPQQVWTALPDGNVDYINQRWHEYTGVTLKQIQDRGWSAIVHPDDLPRVSKTWNKAVETGRNYNIKARLRSADGSYHWFLGRARPLRNERGEIIKWYGTNTDISRIKELEEKLRQQTEDLIRANQLKDEFLAIVSHELRTPLNPILGWSQLITTGKLSPEQTATGLETIHRNAKLQSQLIDDLLDVSRILRGKLDLKVTPVSLETVIRSALATVQLAAEAKSIHMDTVFEPNIGQVLGDAGRLQQIVWNLLSNAIKFTPEGGRITVTLERIDDRAQIQVKDNGKGIEPEFLPYVFDRFRQAENSRTRQFGGLGLGLAIVRHLTELHGGTVSADSAGEGQGATFIVKLPLIKVPKMKQSDDKSIDLSVNPNRFQGIQVLVVDDEVDSLDILTLILEQEGAEVTPVASAHEALEALNRLTPDLIISDIGMPEVDGYTLISQIRELTQGKDIPAIALTAYAGEVDRERSLEVGFKKHMSKPIDITELINIITSLIKSSKL